MYGWVQSTPYFDAKNLPENEASTEERITLQQCIDANVSDCSQEWQDYTNKYWTNYSSEYTELKGLEAYEITIDQYKSEDYHIYSLINDQYSHFSGTHYVVGGCFEDEWGYGYMSEILAKKYLPIVFDQLIPLYSFLRYLLPDIFKAIDQTNAQIMSIPRSSYVDTNDLANLLNLFYLDNTNLFLVGHSISAASMKSIEAAFDIPGIFFETVTSDVADVLMSYFENKELTGRSTINIFERDSLISSYDDEIEEGGALPGVFWNPNVIDTACLSTIACSITTKYVPYCRQALNQGGKDPVKEFERIYEISKEYMDITRTDIDMKDWSF